MSDQSEGPGWWQASNGRWYAPTEQSADELPAPPPGEPRWDRRPVGNGEGHPLANAALTIVLILLVGAIVKAIVG